MTFINDLQGSNHTLHLPPSWVMMEGRGGGGIEPFLRRFKQEGLNTNCDFGWELALQLGVTFFRGDLKTPCIKSSEYKSQARKMFLVVISTMSNFLSTQPNNFLVVCTTCIPFFHSCYILSSPSHKYFLVGAKIFFASCNQRLRKFQISLGPFVLGEA